MVALSNIMGLGVMGRANAGEWMLNKTFNTGEKSLHQYKVPQWQKVRHLMGAPCNCYKVNVFEP